MNVFDKVLSGAASPVAFFKDIFGNYNKRPLLVNESGGLIIGSAAPPVASRVITPTDISTVGLNQIGADIDVRDIKEVTVFIDNSNAAAKTFSAFAIHYSCNEGGTWKTLFDTAADFALLQGYLFSADNGAGGTDLTTLAAGLVGSYKLVEIGDITTIRNMATSGDAALASIGVTGYWNGSSF